MGAHEGTGMSAPRCENCRLPGANSRFSGICAIPNLCSLIDCWQEQEHGRTIPLAEVGSAGDRENPQ
jgi:hypothetical protein